MRQLLVPHEPGLSSKSVELHLCRNEVALRLCIGRLLPALKSEGSPSDAGGSTLGEQGARILRAAWKGEISPDQAATLMQALAHEIERRLRELEERIKSNH